MKIRENIPLSTLTTMRLGGPARYIIDIESIEDVKPAFDFAKQRDLPIFALGSGANTIARDEGFDGIILRYVGTGITDLADLGVENPSSEHTIAISAGTPWDDVVAHCTKRGYTGIEALSKIPGTAGAAPVQNIGAYGQDVSQVFLTAYAYETISEKIVPLERANLHFAYRRSSLNAPGLNYFFVIAITLKLKKGQMTPPFYSSIETYLKDHNITDFSPESIREVVSKIRADKLPDPAKKPSAGSFFKNVYLTKDEAEKAESQGLPVYHGRDGLKISSAWLIEQVGLKGELIHGFRVNEKAPLVLINESATSYAELDQARSEIRSAVKAKFGFELEQEPVEITPMF